jgi:hypothetical protein
MTPRTPEQRLDHAVRQKRHEDNKRKTHVRRQIWVPIRHLDFYQKLMDRLQPIWSDPDVTQTILTRTYGSLLDGYLPPKKKKG